MNKDWLSVCGAYAELANLTLERAVGLSLLLWIKRDIGDISACGIREYAAFERMLEGKKPFPGRWSKSEERKKTKGAVRPDDDPTCYTFEEFWNDYDHKKSIKESKTAFSKLNEADRAEIKKHVASYVRDTPDKKYRLHACTFINQRRWEDYNGQPERDMSLPREGEYLADYAKYVGKIGEMFPDLPKASMFSYSEYASLRNEEWRKDIKTNVGPSVLRSLVEQAHRTAGRALAYDRFITLLKSQD